VPLPLAAVLFLLSFVASAAATTNGGLPAIPGARGPAALVRGAFGCGADPVVLVVDTTSDGDSDGCLGGKDLCTLREALTTRGPRVVVFNTSGVIRLLSRLTVTGAHDCLTVDGGTAPGPLSIANYPLEIAGEKIPIHEMVIRNLRFRPGGEYIAKDLAVATGCNAKPTELCSIARYENGARGASQIARGRVRCDVGRAGDATCVREVGPGSVCRYWERGETNPDETTCDNVLCSLFDQHTGSLADCRDSAVLDGSIIHGIGLRGAVRVLVDGISISWALDDALGVAMRFLGSNDLDVTISRSLIAAQHEPNPPYVGIRDIPTANKCALIGNYTGEDATRSRVLLWRNLFGLCEVRTPRLHGGTTWWINNVFSGSHPNRGTLGFSPLGTIPTTSAFRVDFLSNAFLWSRLEWANRDDGYCAANAPRNRGRGCTVGASFLDCGAAGFCTAGVHRAAFFPSGWSAIYTDGGNRFYDPSRVEVTTTATPAPEFTPEFDQLFRAEDGRPVRNPGSQKGDTRGLPGQALPTPGATVWTRRRSSPMVPEDVPLPVVADASTWPAILDGVGALPRDSVDSELVRIVESGGDYGDQGFLPSSPRAYPAATGRTWKDTDSDGIDDAFESSKCASTGGDCSPLADSGNGYRWIQRFAHADLFGSLQDRPSWGRQCFDHSDNDGDGRIDWPSDPDCVSAEDDDEGGSRSPSTK
jgi:hypothetical protein